MVLRLNSLFTIHILPENTGPHCNYKIIGGEAGAAPAPPPPPPVVTRCIKVI